MLRTRKCIGLTRVFRIAEKTTVKKALELLSNKLSGTTPDEGGSSSESTRDKERLLISSFNIELGTSQGKLT